MDIHVDQQDRSTFFLGQPTMPDSFFPQTQIQAMDFLEGCVRGLEPLAAFTGGAGTGKTLVLNTVLERIGGRVIRVNNFVAGPLSLHRVLASAVGVPDAGDLSAEALEPALRQALAMAGQSEPPLLAVDDAQSLLPETLHYLCLLAGLREAGRPLLRILLVGRPGFTVRQSMPLQFTLNAASPDDARRIVLHGLDTAGISASDEAVQDIVSSSHGNLRKLELLLNASIDQAKASGRRRIASVGVQQAAGTRPLSRPKRRASPISPWLAVPALLVVGVAGAGVAHHNGLFHQAPDKVVSPPPIPASAAPSNSASLNPAQDTAPPAASSSPAPVVTASSEPSRLPSVPAPLPTTPAAPVPVPVAPVVPLPSVQAPSTTGTTSSEPSAPAPVAPAPVTPAPVTSAPADSGLATSTSADPAPPNSTSVAPPPAADSRQPAAADAPPPPPATPQPAPVAQASVPSSGTRYRVYNISSCHQGICPRWSVTDLDQQSRFVAAFNPASLHLDRGTMQKLREGSLDLIVSGSVRRGGGGSQTLDADSLQSVAPHHGRARPAGTDDPIDLAPPPTQSPPPGFLTLPPGESH